MNKTLLTALTAAVLLLAASDNCSAQSKDVVISPGQPVYGVMAYVSAPVPSIVAPGMVADSPLGNCCEEPLSCYCQNLWDTYCSDQACWCSRWLEHHHRQRGCNSCNNGCSSHRWRGRGQRSSCESCSSCSAPSY